MAKSLGVPVAVAIGSAVAADLTIGALRKEVSFIRQRDIAAEDEKEAPAPIRQNSTVYYGADIYGGTWKIVTPPMNYDAAIAWVISIANSGVYGKRASWGVYTKTNQDAGSFVQFFDKGIPIHHDGKAGEFPHYHVSGYTFMGKYEHFHVWYGILQ